MHKVLFHEHPDTTPVLHFRQTCEGAMRLAHDLLRTAPVGARAYHIEAQRLYFIDIFCRMRDVAFTLGGAIDPVEQKKAAPGATETAS